MSTDRILRWPEVRKITGLGRTTAWEQIKKKRFPAPVKITEHRVGWLESDINAWLASRRRAA
ncbi:helix-turn-helix transcriptional regulator [Microvirga lenta]|uniref:helix-turn-helix transcriptional regulator n=1 Tax=Microvirga lenta TaxID=2881337 RepID=UPI001CFFF430|nr:AlpA family phage regulatory protein [Microvirga lenta]MCB5176771.1 AlpA family phage regulatory protein [Microvirga lenta]